MKLQYLAVITALLSCLTGVSSAQTYTVSGEVTTDNGTALALADVYLSRIASDKKAKNEQVISYSRSTSDQTNQQGYYKITDITPGRYTVTAFYSGRKIISHKVTLKRENHTVDFTLPLLQNSLDEITVGGQQEETFGIRRLAAVEGVTINEGKKNEVILIDDMAANLATNNSRQVYSKVAGLNIWQSDGAGVQTSIGGRGLSPKRNSNFNTRQNGYDIAADALGYPESYYTPPTRALKRIEIIRGAASLQYGTQFGGMLNFVFKDGPEDDPFELTSHQTYGSYGLFNSFNSVGGETDDINYYGFYQYKTNNGWRPNSQLDQHTAYGSVSINASDKLTVTPEFTYMHYLAQQPGGLTDTQFERNPSQSNRERNWFRVDWNLLALKANYQFSGMTQLNTRFFGLKASRSAVGNLRRIDRSDNPGTPRNLLKDEYNNWGNETRLIHRYPFFDNISVFLAGFRYYDGFTHRRQGEGSSGNSPNFNYSNPDSLTGSDFDLPSQNQSFFIENIFNITPEFSITPGIRLENIRTEADGYYRKMAKDLAGNTLQDTTIQEQRNKERSFLLYGLGVSYKPSSQFELYANYSQNYRAINFNDIRVDVGNLEVDPNIGDEQGFNTDLGIRGQISNFFNYDLSLFHLSYQNRIGTVLKKEDMFSGIVDVHRTFRYRTNVADAQIYGVETFAELDFYKYFIDPSAQTQLSAFSNLAFISARYSNSQEYAINGNKVENAPDINFKTGITFAKNGFSATYQYTYVSEHYSDATNARSTTSATYGIIPAYQVHDLSAEYTYRYFRFEAGVNNLTDNRYFTRRATGYPGPGIIPAKARSFYLTMGIKL